MIADRDRLAASSAHSVALDCLTAGIQAAHPQKVIEDTVALDGHHLIVKGNIYDLSEYERVEVVGGGKAAGEMAHVLESILGCRLDGGVVVSDTPSKTAAVEIVTGSHPIPSEAGEDGARRVLKATSNADADTLLLVTISGGGSALLPAPAANVDIEALRGVTTDLLESGAAIGDINSVRKHLSSIKGGGLAAAAQPASAVGLVLSDVVGNDPAVIASGPLSPDPTTFEDALAVIDRYDIDTPASVRDRLNHGVDGSVPETPKPDNPVFESVDVHILADGRTALEAAAKVAAERGYNPQILSSRIRGEAREAATTHVAIAEEIRATDDPFHTPAVILSGGETTVAVRGDGVGGPNQEFALSAAIDLNLDAVVVAAMDTDGLDGVSDAAGAIIDSHTVADHETARSFLADNDAGGYLRKCGALLETGPTKTNVNDLRAIVVENGVDSD